MLFPATPSRAPQFDQTMRAHLALSLERLGEMAAALLADEADMAPALAHIRAHRVDPGVFARYYDLVFALQKADHPAARKLWREIAALAGPEAQLQLLPFGMEALGDDAERFGRLFSLAYGGVSLFARPQADDWRTFERHAAEGLALLDEAAPAWAAELRGLLVRVIGAQPSGEPGAPWFADASSFMVWGAIMMNVAQESDRLKTLIGLAHEATHQLLFALSRDEPLVTNPPAARYRSPLRRDARPMDGVFHATYVVARLVLLFEDLLGASALLTPAEGSEIESRLQQFRTRFGQGYGVLRADAMLTPLGKRLIEEAASHVMAPA